MSAPITKRPSARYQQVQDRKVTLSDVVCAYLDACEEAELTLSEFEAELAERIEHELITGELLQA
jgi:hypothetical protein